MVRIVTVISLRALITWTNARAELIANHNLDSEVHALKFTANHNVGAQDSEDKLANNGAMNDKWIDKTEQSMDKLADKLVEQVLDSLGQPLKVAHVHHKHLDQSTLGRLDHVASPARMGMQHFLPFRTHPVSTPHGRKSFRGGNWPQFRRQDIRGRHIQVSRAVDEAEAKAAYDKDADAALTEAVRREIAKKAKESPMKATNPEGIMNITADFNDVLEIAPYGALYFAIAEKPESAVTFVFGAALYFLYASLLVRSVDTISRSNVKVNGTLKPRLFTLFFISAILCIAADTLDVSTLGIITGFYANRFGQVYRIFREYLSVAIQFSKVGIEKYPDFKNIKVD